MGIITAILGLLAGLALLLGIFGAVLYAGFRVLFAVMGFAERHARRHVSAFTAPNFPHLRPALVVDDRERDRQVLVNAGINVDLTRVVPREAERANARKLARLK